MTDEEYLSVAVIEAKKAQWRTWENPRVGAVIVKDDEILATGYHHYYGGQHAEIDAYENLADKAAVSGATIYVTLEPCAHIGKVGSCAEALITWQPARVVVGQVDPNPLVAGKGIAKLEAAGIPVTVLNNGVSQQINPAFHYYFDNQKMPFVTLKLAQSLNGKITAGPEQQTKITTEIADVDVHVLRANQQAILIGGQTAKIDQPQLNVRHVRTAYQPLRVILNRRGCPLTVDENTLMFTANEVFARQNVNVRYLKDFTLHNVLQELGRHGIQSVLVEGGSKTIEAFIAEKLWQKIVVYQSPTMLPDTGLTGFKANKIIETGRLTGAEIIGENLKFEIERD